MSNSIAPGSSADVNVKVTALTTNPNVPVTYKTIILKKNLVNGVNTLTQEMMSATNTKYVVKYDYVLGEDVTIPAGCILEFDGGSLSGAYTITGNNTSIKANEKDIIFTAVSFSGTWNITDIYATWFSDIETRANTLIDVFNLTSNEINNNVYIQEGIICNLTPIERSSEPGTSDCIFLKSNTKIYLNGTVKITPNDFYEYSAFQLHYKDNVSFIGTGSIIGDKDEHTYTERGEGDTHEWGYGIWIDGGFNITVKGITFSKFTGDGMFIDNSQDNHNTNKLNNIYISGVNINNCRRQGISIQMGNGITIEDFVISDISGTSPSSGIDIEPFGFNCNNVIIKNGKISNAAQGIMITKLFVEHYSTDRVKNITIDNIEYTNCPVALYIGHVENVFVNNQRFNESFNQYIYIVDANNIVIENSIFPNISNKNSLIEVNPDDTGNILFRHCTFNRTIKVNNSIITDCIFNTDSYFLGESTGTRIVQNVKIKNSIIVGCARGIFKDVYIENCVIYNYQTNIDPYLIRGFDGTTNIVLKNNCIYTFGTIYITGTGGKLLFKDNTWIGRWKTTYTEYVVTEDSTIQLKAQGNIYFATEITGTNYQGTKLVDGNIADTLEQENSVSTNYPIVL